jgi:hypothetical protein
MPLSKDLREFVELLNSNGVEYLVVGGFAVSYHGFARYTGEDFLVRPSEENSRRVLAALAQFGFGSVGIHAEDFRSPDKVVQLGVPPNPNFFWRKCDNRLLILDLYDFRHAAYWVRLDRRRYLQQL